MGIFVKRISFAFCTVILKQILALILGMSKLFVSKQTVQNENTGFVKNEKVQKKQKGLHILST